MALAIEFIMHITRSRQTRVFTAFGETEAFNPKCGIEQGECNAPLMWNIFYDPLLTRLQSLNSGYSLSRNHHFDGTANTALLELLKTIPLSSFSYQTLAEIVLSILWTIVYYQIWLPRCQETIAFEKENKITSEMKRRYQLPPATNNSKPSSALKFGISSSLDAQCWRSTFL